MQCIIFGCIFHSKAINNWTKNIISCGTFEENWHETWVGVVVELGVFDEHNIGKLSCSWEAMHDFESFEKDYVVNKEILNLVFINEILGLNPLW